MQGAGGKVGFRTVTEITRERTARGLCVPAVTVLIAQPGACVCARVRMCVCVHARVSASNTALLALIPLLPALCVHILSDSGAPDLVWFVPSCPHGARTVPSTQWDRRCLLSVGCWTRGCRPGNSVHPQTWQGRTGVHGCGRSRSPGNGLLGV